MKRHEYLTSPINPTDAPTAPDTDTNIEIHTTTLEDDIQVLQERLRESYDEYQAYNSSNKATKSAIRLAYKRQFARPLLDTFHRYSDEYTGKEKKRRFVARFSKSVDNKNPHKVKKLVASTLNMELALELAQHTLNQDGIDTNLPSDHQIRQGADLCIDGTAYRFMFGPSIVSSPIVQHHESKKIPSIKVIIPGGEPNLHNPLNVLIRNQLKTQVAVTERGNPAIKQPPTTKEPTLVRYEDQSVLTQGLPGGYHVGIDIDERHKEPPYEYSQDVHSMRGERLALQLIDLASDHKGRFDSQTEAANRLRASIDNNDPEAIRVLKLFAAKLCHGNNIEPSLFVKAVGNSLRAAEIRDLYTHFYEWSHADSTDSVDRLASFMNSLSGFRVEESVIKIARAAGYRVVPATKEQDRDGIDMFIDGIPFDVKSSSRKAKKHIHAYRKNETHYHPVIFIPPLTEADFAGELVVDDSRVDRILARTNFREMIDEAVMRYIEAHPTPETSDNVA